VWLVIKADGVRQQLASQFFYPRRPVHLNWGNRIVLDLDSLEGCYLMTSLCSFASADRRIIAVLACAQIPLSTLYLRPGTSFAYPLLKTGDLWTQAVILTARTNLRPLDFQALEQRQSYAEVAPVAVPRGGEADAVGRAQ
jgi:hypothetical protein